VEAGVKAEETLSLLSLPMAPSERIARLKASRRLRLVKINDWLVAFSSVSAYQASAARAFISVGAHVAVVAGEKGERLQVSLRATQDFIKRRVCIWAGMLPSLWVNFCMAWVGGMRFLLESTELETLKPA